MTQSKSNRSMEKQKTLCSRRHYAQEIVIKKVRYKYLAKIRPFLGVKVSCLVDHLNLTLQDDKPGHILHTGTNDLQSQKTSRSNFKICYRIVMLQQFENALSGIVLFIWLMHRQRYIALIFHSETIDTSKHLNETKLHFSAKIFDPL